MYICNDCGHVFDDGESQTERDYRGECHGSPSYEEYRVCPVCGGNYDEAVKCAECGDYAAVSDLESGICPDCVKRTDKELRAVLLNCFSPAQREYLEDSYEIA